MSQGAMLYSPTVDVSTQNYIDFESSLLEFNRRVLHEAFDPRTPLLERVKFASIFWSNLDEFFLKRVGGLKRQIMAKIVPRGTDTRSPSEKLVDVRSAVQALIREKSEGLSSHLLPELYNRGIQLVKWGALSEEEAQLMTTFFQESVFPVLTPLSVDPGHPFPFISSLSTSIGVILRHPTGEGEELFARVKIPSVFPAWIRVNPKQTGSYRFISLLDIVEHFLDRLFPGMQIASVMAFRIIRNADVGHEDEDAEDLLEMVSQEIRDRRFAEIVRLDHGPNPSSRILNILCDELDVSASEIYELPLPLDFFSLQALSELSLPEFKYPSWVPSVPPLLTDTENNFFDVLRETDILVHHPYESFRASVERFILAAAEDPKVLAIKMTLYRTGDSSPFIPLLIRAAEAGKQVVCLVELKARFDEARNILVAQQLEDAGVHVVYGVLGLKTHCKVALVVRQERDGVRTYCHVGTGNYHSKTAQLYTDLGYFTAKPSFTEDVVHLFHYLTGRSLSWNFKKLLVAPIDMKASFLRMIAREAEHATQGRPNGIVAKMNSLEDTEVIDALSKASQMGVRIDLIVRGVCCLRPQVPGVSENIRVVSVVGRFLEHSRMFYFRNGSENPLDGDFFIGSADWMSRNLNSRVEACVPIEPTGLKQKCWDILNVLLNDQRQAWDMHADGHYVQRNAVGPLPARGAHDILMLMSPPSESPRSRGRMRRPPRPRKHLPGLETSP